MFCSVKGKWTCVFSIIFQKLGMIPLLGVVALSISTTVACIGMHGSSGYEPCRRFALPASDRPGVGTRTIRQFMKEIFSRFLLDGPVSDKFRWTCDRLATQIRDWQTRWRLTQLRNVSVSCVAVLIECGTPQFFS